MFKKEVPAEIVKWDKNNDLAVLATGLKLKTLELSDFDPWSEYWVMALGSADGYEGNEDEDITHDSSLGQTPTEGSVR